MQTHRIFDKRDAPQPTGICIDALIQKGRNSAFGGNVYHGTIVPADVVREVLKEMNDWLVTNRRFSKTAAYKGIAFWLHRLSDYHRAYANCGIYLRDFEECFTYNPFLKVQPEANGGA